MKNFLKLIVLIVTLASFNKHAFSCDSLNVTIGDDFSKVTDILDFIDDYEAENYEEGTTAEYEGHTAIYCPDSGLDNTKIKGPAAFSAQVPITLRVYNEKFILCCNEDMDVSLRSSFNDDVNC